MRVKDMIHFYDMEEYERNGKYINPNNHLFYSEKWKEDVALITRETYHLFNEEQAARFANWAWVAFGGEGISVRTDKARDMADSLYFIMNGTLI